MIGAARAEVCERLRVARADEAEDLGGAAEMSDLALVRGDAAADERQDLGRKGARVGGGLGARPAEQGAALLADAREDELTEVVSGLPVSGLSGTMKRRFGAAATEDVAGVPRAKTGTLRAGSALAGTTVDADGRPLTFAVLVDEFPASYGGTLRARAALDRIVAVLTRCGCR